jgi:hypothetical protein
MVVTPLAASVAARTVVVVVILLTLWHVLMVAYEVSVARRARRAQLMRSFQRLLPARLVLHVAALLWALAVLLRVPLLWQVNEALHPFSLDTQRYSYEPPSLPSVRTLALHVVNAESPLSVDSSPSPRGCGLAHGAGGLAAAV